MQTTADYDIGDDYLVVIIYSIVYGYLLPSVVFMLSSLVTERVRALIARLAKEGQRQTDIDTLDPNEDKILRRRDKGTHGLSSLYTTSYTCTRR